MPTLNYLCMPLEPWRQTLQEMKFSKAAGIDVSLNGVVLGSVTRCDVQRGYVDVYRMDKDGYKARLGDRVLIDRLFGHVTISLPEV